MQSRIAPWKAADFADLTGGCAWNDPVWSELSGKCERPMMTGRGQLFKPQKYPKSAPKSPVAAIHTHVATPLRDHALLRLDVRIQEYFRPLVEFRNKFCL